MTEVAGDSVLVTGGAGYIGSHTLLACRDSGYRVVVLDDLSKGLRGLVPADVAFYQGDVGDVRLLKQIFADHQVTSVIHFAASVVVPESVAQPLSYYLNNTCKTRSLLEACNDAGIKRFVFSSTAAVYGQPATSPVAETTPAQPVNPYGTSKLMSEWMLRDAALAHGLRYVVLRYFNVAGADPGGRSGQATPEATHLVKVACEAVAGRRSGIQIFGDDYDTPDGTCVRDYIHVSDLARAHVNALDYLKEQGASVTLNCGYGRGYSVRQVVEAVQRIADAAVPVTVGARRDGDVAELIADSTRLRSLFGWTPQHDDLDFILRTALDWELGQTVHS